jgi:hypothetical protein
MQAVKKSRIKVSDKRRDSITFMVDGKILDKVDSKFVYKLFIKRKNNAVKILRVSKYVTPDLYISNILNTCICHLMVLDTETREFQFRFLHDILTKKYWLKKWKIIETSTCSFCNQSEEDIHHLIWGCQETQRFWKGVERWLTPTIGQGT